MSAQSTDGEGNAFSLENPHCFQPGLLGEVAVAAAGPLGTLKLWVLLPWVWKKIPKSIL